MNIDLSTRHLPDRPRLLEFTQRRAAFAFARFGGQVRAVAIRLDDVNGPRGGMGISCLARLRLAQGGELLVESAASSPEQGIASVLTRLAGRLRRLASFRQDHR
jgi:hypothetical protein